MPQDSFLPDGTPFDFWNDETAYEEVFHVACEHGDADDDNPGDAQRPWKTLAAAADRLQPGQKVVVHGGTYRECVRPARGGDGPERMIAYEAADGEEVVITGCERLELEPTRSEGWRLGRREAPRVWMADMPAEWFIGYNPFLANNVFAHLGHFIKQWTTEELERFQLRRGAVFHRGRPLKQVLHPYRLLEQDGAFWVEEPGLRIHFRLPGDADPAGESLEVTAREQCFAPRQRGLGYIRLRGLVFRGAGDGLPVPQRAMVSAGRGHHWIIEHCRIEHANAVGLDVGQEDWRADRQVNIGRHILRANHIHHCGVCGLAGAGGVRGMLVEDNLVEHVGGLVPERLWESAGIKLHRTHDLLMRRNVLRHIREACGVWLDCLNRNSRVTRNAVADIETRLTGIYVEASQQPNLVDHNLVWDVRYVETGEPNEFAGVRGGFGIDTDSSENCLCAHNLVGRVADDFAICHHLTQYDRVIDGRTGLCRRHRVLNNVIVECAKRVYFARREENVSDGNLFDLKRSSRSPGRMRTRSRPASLVIGLPHPPMLMDLAGWREYFGWGAGSVEADVEAAFDPETLRLRLKVTFGDSDERPECLPVEELRHEGAPPCPGPFTAHQWERACSPEGLEITAAELFAIP